MKSLITGGAGFIGSHFAEELLNQGDDVYIIDDLSTGSIENIEHLKKENKFQYFIDSISNKQLMAELIDKCDVIYHLAAAVGVKLIVESPVRTIETNITGTEIVLKLANKKKKTVIIASSSEVYGKSNNFPYEEGDDLVLGPTYKGRWSYACSKAIDEFLALAYYKEKKLPIIIIRLFNTVGPRQTDAYGMVVPSFVKQALLDHSITVYGDGQQSRCFTHVKDIVGGIIKLSHQPDAIGRVFNIGNTEEITIENLAKLVKTITKSHSKIVHIPYDEAYEEGFEDMRRRVPDISRIQKLTGYKPTYDVKEIVKSVVEFYRNK